jgi:hypothetical protein
MTPALRELLSEHRFEWESNAICRCGFEGIFEIGRTYWQQWIDHIAEVEGAKGEAK